MKKSLLSSIVLLLFFQFYSYDTSAQITTDQLLENTYKLYDYQRQSNGVYRDTKIINGGDYHPSSVANTGVGLISLCIADRAGYIQNGRAQAAQTLRTMLGYTSGFTPDRNSKGFYRHFIDINTGDQAWNSEYSTIDTALLAAGALFAKNYFNDAEISFWADELFLSIDWGTAISNPSNGAIWREQDANGNGQGTSALPFNEYIIVAYLAMKSEGDSGGVGTSAWNVWQQLDNFANANYWGYELLADFDDVSAFQSDFTVQFPYYLISWAHNSDLYKGYMNNMASADNLYYEKIAGNYPGLNDYEWGLGAGSSPTTFNGTFYTEYGYNADHINNHKASVVSPHIVAGYIPIRPSAKNDLQQMLNGTKGIYTLNTGEQLLWRYSLDEINWNSDQIQGIDYSTMLYGLAADKFGVSFFTDNNAYEFPEECFYWSSSCIGDARHASGEVIKSTDSSNENNHTSPKAFNDNNQWIGLDLGSSQEITCVRFKPQRGFGYQMHGGIFQVSDDANFSNPRTIFTVPTKSNLSFKDYYITNENANGISARYVRYVAPNNVRANLAEFTVYKSATTSKFSNLEKPELQWGNNNSQELTISPNPASKSIELNFFPQENGPVEYRIYNIQGMMVDSFEERYNSDGVGATKKTVNVENLAEGVYFIHVKTGTKNLNKKFVVLK